MNRRDLTNRQWERLQPLLPSQKPPEGIFAMVSAAFGLVQASKQIEALPKEQQEGAAIEAFARYLVAQGIRAYIDETG